MKTPLSLSIILVSLLAILPVQAKSTTVLEVEGKAAAEKLEERDVVVLDVRTPQEVALGRIAGSVNINIADPDFSQKIAKLDPSKTYMVHCAAGSPGGRSYRTVSALEKLGVSKIYHLSGGFNGWKNAGNAVEIPKE